MISFPHPIFQTWAQVREPECLYPKEQKRTHVVPYLASCATVHEGSTGTTRRRDEAGLLPRSTRNGILGEGLPTGVEPEEDMVSSPLTSMPSTNCSCLNQRVLFLDSRAKLEP